MEATNGASRAASDLLQSAEVPSMAVMANETLAVEPHVAPRGAFVEIEHPELGRTRVMGSYGGSPASLSRFILVH